jgi:hypothetical protein
MLTRKIKKIKIKSSPPLVPTQGTTKRKKKLSKKLQKTIKNPY